MLLTLAKDSGSGPSHYDGLIHPEPMFRHLGAWIDMETLTRRVVVSRWTGHSIAPQEHQAEILDEYHTIGISMIPTQLRLSVADSVVFEGTLEPGAVQLSGPGQSLRLQTRGAYDWIHVHVGNGLLRTCQARLQPQTRKCPLGVPPEALFRDPVIQDLINGLVNMQDPSTPVSALCGESIILAVIARILGRLYQAEPAAVASRANALIAWRLKRVKDFVAEHLADPITLADLGLAAGLTRMHFAAQFRAATGYRPHDYVLQQRILRAKELLRNTDLPLVEIALAVGFQTQAHFTTVFRRIALATPHQWRCRERTSRPTHILPVVTRSAPRIPAGAPAAQ